MVPVALTLAGAALSVLAFPRFGPGWLVIPGVALWMMAMRRAESGHVWLGLVFGIGFYGGLLWWISLVSEGMLGMVAAGVLVLLQAGYAVAFGWWMGRWRRHGPAEWSVAAISGWAIVELIRYRFPFSGFEWGGFGYALSDQSWALDSARWVGASGWTALVVAVGATVAILIEDRRRLPDWGVMAGVVVFAVAGAVAGPAPGDAAAISVVIVQGSTPCPFEHCPPNERLRTYMRHLDLTRQLPPGSADLVVWSEGSTGSTNADPVLVPDIAEEMGVEARRIGGWLLAGGDRVLSAEDWVNANVVFDSDGVIVGEYRKQQPVPFGEYVPFRSLFAGIEELQFRVPRDMIAGEGPVVFDIAGIPTGSVISFEGSFARYARAHVAAGARLLVVATNEGTYGQAPASDQLIGMTRMRSAELGVDVIHAAVTGRSVIINRGRLGDITGLGTTELATGTVTAAPSRTFYAVAGDWLMVMAALAGLLLPLGSRLRERRRNERGYREPSARGSDVPPAPGIRRPGQRQVRGP